MKLYLRFLLPILALLVVAVWWLWWNQPQRVDMAAYVPADSLLYIEANNLPDIVSGIVSTDAWKALAPPAGLSSSLSGIRWLSRAAAWTGIGSADAVVFSRAQIAVTVLALDAAEAGDTLKIKPRAALVIESHTSEARTRHAVEKRVGDFAHRAYGEPQVKRRESDGIQFITWSTKTGERQIVAAVIDTVAVIGNDEAAVRACLSVRRGERPSLMGNKQLEEMRKRLGSSEAVAFGYVSPTGAAKISEVAATAYAAQFSSDTQAQSFAASMFPQLVPKILGSAGWSTRFVDGVVEDRYFLALQNGLASRLQEPLAATEHRTLSASELLPAETYSITSYNYRDPEAAWRGLNTAISSQLGILGEVFVPRLLEGAFKPYGIDEPGHFLRSIGPEIVTARINDRGASTVIIVAVRDEKSLRELINKRLGANTRSERVGDAELIIAKDAQRGAASFTDGHLVMGSAENVRRCLLARKEAKTLSTAEAFKRSASQQATAPNSPSVMTYTNDGMPARAFISAVVAQRVARERNINHTELERALDRLSYAASETRLNEDGFERKTHSSFGQLGVLTTQFAPESSTQALR